jgi:hypothetical protein
MRRNRNSLGKGEVVGSIPPGSTIFLQQNQPLSSSARGTSAQSRAERSVKARSRLAHSCHSDVRQAFRTGGHYPPRKPDPLEMAKTLRNGSRLLPSGSRSFHPIL